MESLSRPSTLLENLLSTIPLVLEVGGLGVPVINFVQDHIEKHDLLCEQSGDSGGKEADEDIVVHDASMGNIAPEGQDVTLKGRRELSIFLCHLMGGKPGDDVPSDVLVFEDGLELLEKVIPSSKGDNSTRDDFFTEGVCSGQGRHFSHIQECKGNLLCVSVIGFLINSKIELDGIHL